MKNRVLNVRVPEDLAAELEEIASYDEVAVADVVREATMKLIASRYADPDFKQRVLESAERTRLMLEKIGSTTAERYDFRETPNAP